MKNSRIALAVLALAALAAMGYSASESKSSTVKADECCSSCCTDCCKK